jgi:hypothetical protein
MNNTEWAPAICHTKNIFKKYIHLAADIGRATRSAEDPLNLRQKAARLEVRRHFLSNRVVEAWNLIPSIVKNARTVSALKRAYKKIRAEMVTPT